MASKSKPVSPLGKLNIFANSPSFVRVFRPAIILLILVAAFYGGFVLISEKLSSAATRTFYYYSPNIYHSGGHATTDASGSPVWQADPGDTNKYVWWGPYKSLTSNRQYIGCFHYTHKGTAPATVLIDIVNGAGTETLRRETITTKGDYNDRLHVITPTPEGESSGVAYERTCLAFFVPANKTAKNVELRFIHKSGTLIMRKTSIKGLSPADSGGILKNHDNSTIIWGDGFMDYTKLPTTD